MIQNTIELLHETCQCAHTYITEHFIESSAGLDILMREGNEDVFLSAGASGHVFLLVVKLVVAGL